MLRKFEREKIIFYENLFSQKCWQPKSNLKERIKVEHKKTRKEEKIKYNIMADEEVLFDDVYELCEVIGKWVSGRKKILQHPSEKKIEIK